MAYADGGQIEIGRILSRGFGYLRQNLLLFVGTAFVVATLPFIVVLIGAGLVMGDVNAALESTALSSSTGFLSTMLYWLAQAVIVYTVLMQHAGYKPALRDSFRHVGKFFPLIIGASLLALLATVLGLVFLVIPGIIVYIMFSVAMPVILQEETGATESLSRSRDLTRGSRWSIFLLLVIGSLITMVAIAPLLAMTVIAPQNLLALEIGSWLMNVVLLPIYSVLTASLYIDLRTVRDGMGTEEVSEIFA